MIDTHAHLDFREFDKDRNEIIESCHSNVVKFIINIGVDLATSMASIKLADKYDFVYATVGYHPHDSKDMTGDIFREIKGLASHPKVVAIGEIGLDFYRDLSPRDIQRKVFIKQLDLAAELNLPVVMHIRQALDEVYAILEKREGHSGVLHAFPGDAAYATRGVDMGYHIAFGGPITYPKSNKTEVAASVPSFRILTETDCPYLPPQKFRGKRNQPDYIRYVIEKLTESFPKYNYEDIERITELNAARLFKLPLDNPAKVVYKIGDSLYLNINGRCTNNCYFCPRNTGYNVAGHNLLLNREPSEKEILDGIEEYKDYSEIVFCGLGEPTLRADLMLSLAGRLKSKGVSIRLNTNGQGSLINKTDLPRKMAGMIDSVNVSLNAQDDEVYGQVCKPQFGQTVYGEVLNFARRCKEERIDTVFSVVDIQEIDIEECQKIAAKIGVPLKVRNYAGV
jgi:TatD DNase family protein